MRGTAYKIYKFKSRGKELMVTAYNESYARDFIQSELGLKRIKLEEYGISYSAAGSTSQVWIEELRKL